MKKINIFLIITLIAILLGGCGLKVADNSTNNKKESQKIDLSKVTLVLGDQAKMTRTKLEAAKALDGIPYKIKWANFQGAAPLFEAIKSGDVDTAPAGDTPVLAAAASGTPIKIVATTTSSTKGIVILASKKSAIRSVADLKGQTVYVSSAKGSISEYLLIGALKEVGLTTKDVKVSYILPTDALAAFDSGKIDIWATFDPYAAEAEAQGARVLRDGTNINTGFGFTTASTKALADPAKKAAIADYLKRLEKATEWGNNHLDEYVKVYSQLTGLDENISKTIINRGKQSTTAVSDADITKLQEVSDTFFESNVLTTKVNVKSIVDKSVFGK